jgi:hypothetical protein
MSSNNDLIRDTSNMCWDTYLMWLLSLFSKNTKLVEKMVGELCYVVYL